jgi:hypothetical protein
MYGILGKNNLMHVVFGENILEVFYNFQDT